MTPGLIGRSARAACQMPGHAGDDDTRPGRGGDPPELLQGQGDAQQIDR